jgi:hypothetical protein
MRWPLPLLLASLGCAPADPPPRPKAGPIELPPPSKPEPAERRCDEVEAVAVTRKALEAVPAHGVDPGHLADCLPEEVWCSLQRWPLPGSDRCQQIAYQVDASWYVHIAPTAATGVPVELEIWFEDSAKKAGNVQVSGSTWGVVEGVRIEGQGNHASQTHDGAPARIGTASFEVENLRDEPVTLVLQGTRWLEGPSCELPRTERARPKATGIALFPDSVEGKMSVTIPGAGSFRTVLLEHEPQQARVKSCERFAIAATFDVGGERVEVIAEHGVMQRTP